MSMLRLRQISDSYYCLAELFGQYELRDRSTCAFLGTVMAAYHAVEDSEDPIQAMADKLCAGDRARAYQLVETGLQYFKEDTGLLEFINEGPVEESITPEWLLERVRSWFQSHAVMHEYDPGDPMSYCRDHETPQEPVFVKICKPPYGREA